MCIFLEATCFHTIKPVRSPTIIVADSATGQQDAGCDQQAKQHKKETTMFSPLYLIVMLLGAGITLWAQWKVQSTYKKYAQVRNMRNLTGLDVARVLMRNEGIDHVRIEQIGGELTDHYDPRAKVMRLSAGSIAHPSVAAMAVVAHELGHALQDQQDMPGCGYVPGIVGIVMSAHNLAVCS
jgi:Predicted Zn-dependent protease